jgi:very-short-patch-repair endonuclease
VREGSHLEKRKINVFARNLRHSLRDRRLGGYKFRRQHPIKDFILDFYCPEKKLAVELDGGQHSEGSQMIYDQSRSAILEKEGIKVLRYWDNEVLQNTDGILDDILMELGSR